MTDDVNLIYYSKLVDPESFPGSIFMHYEPCACGKTLEESLRFDGTTLVKLTARDNEFKQQVICKDCLGPK